MTIPGIECALQYPLLGSGTLCFIAMVTLCAVPRFRFWLLPRLEMPLPSTRQHLLPLDAYRGLAALWVALFHAWQWTMPVFKDSGEMFQIITVGHYGVQFFVVLSGMLIYRSLRSLRDLDHLRAYFWRRLLRICPLYAAVSAIFLIVSPPGLGASIAELFMFRSLGHPAFMNPPAWSIYVEALFYLVMPAFVLLAARRPVLAAAVIFVLLLLGDHPGTREMALWKFFFLGVLCSEAIDRAMTWRSLPARALPFVAGAGMVGFAVFSALRPGYLGHSEREVFLGFGVALMLLGTVSTPWLRTIFSLRPLRILGTISYSIYLVHPLLLIQSFGLKFSVPATEILSRSHATTPMHAADIMIIYVPALVFFSCCTYLAIERPMLRLRPTAQVVSTA